MNSFKVNAIVVRRRNFMEKDRILTLFSREEGKIEALAKGARRPGNRLSPNCDLATIAKFHIHNAKSLDIVTEIEPIYHPFGARGEFEKTQKISYALKLVDKLFDFGEAHQHTYNALEALIESISSESRQLVFLKFLLEVMDELGSMPSFVNCTHCQKQINSTDSYVFSVKGGLTHQDCVDGHTLAVGAEEIKLLRLLSSVSTEDVANFKVDKKTFEKTYVLIAQYFNWEFGKILPDKVM